MKTIGLLGGMSWQSTIPYYRILNEAVRERLGGHHSAKLVLHSVDFAPLEAMMRESRWDAAAAVLVDAASSVERAGAELLLLCTNTLHKVAPAIASSVSIPFLHIADATAAAIRPRGLRRVALLGTKFTMEQPFLRERLEQNGLEVLIPDEDDRAEIHRAIFDELIAGVFRAETKDRFIAAIELLARRGAEGVIFGCTEIGLLVKPHEVSIPAFDTTEIHARAAVEMALA